MLWPLLVRSELPELADWGQIQQMYFESAGGNFWVAELGSTGKIVGTIAISPPNMEVYSALLQTDQSAEICNSMELKVRYKTAQHFL